MAVRKLQDRQPQHHAHQNHDDHEEEHRRHKQHAEEEEGEPWLVSYADLMTLLFGFFVLMFSFASAKEGTKNLEKFKDAMAKQFGHEAKTATVDDERKHQPVITTNSFSSDWEIGTQNKQPDVQEKNIQKKTEKVLMRKTQSAQISEFHLIIPVNSLFLSDSETLSDDGKQKIAQIAVEFVGSSNAEKMVVEVHGAFQAESRKDSLRRTAYQSSSILSELISSGVPAGSVIVGGYGDLFAARGKKKKGGSGGAGSLPRDQHVLFRIQSASETARAEPR
jgi:chemotaxis protein MotB